MSTAPNLKRTTFATSRLLDFCSEKELERQTGYTKGDWPLYILKELLDNALDITEEAGATPDITVTVDKTSIAVRDNGPGLEPATIARMLDFSHRLSSREAFVSPTRGQQGNALQTVIPMPYALTGTAGPAVTVRSHGVRSAITFEVDHIRQQPVPKLATTNERASQGTEILVHWPNSACSILETAKARFLQIGDDYTWLNPHLSLTVDWFGAKTKIDRTMQHWSKWMPSDPTSPHWYTVEALERLIAAYVSNGQGAKTVRELVSEFRGLSGTAKQQTILVQAQIARTTLADLCPDNHFDRPAITRLLAAMQAASKPVPAKLLGLIGKEHLAARFTVAKMRPETFEYAKALDATANGLPCVVETAFAYCPELEGDGDDQESDGDDQGDDGEETRRRLVTAVNWSPAIRNPFRELGELGESLDTFLANARVHRTDPIITVVHVACPQVHYTDRGKTSLVLD